MLLLLLKHELQRTRAQGNVLCSIQFLNTCCWLGRVHSKWCTFGDCSAKLLLTVEFKNFQISSSSSPLFVRSNIMLRINSLLSKQSLKRLFTCFLSQISTLCIVLKRVKGSVFDVFLQCSNYYRKDTEHAVMIALFFYVVVWGTCEIGLLSFFNCVIVYLQRNGHVLRDQIIPIDGHPITASVTWYKL